MTHPFDQQAEHVLPEERRPGAGPGLLVAPEDSPKPVLDVVLAGNGEKHEVRNVDVAALRRLRREQGADQWIWLDVNGLGDTSVIAAIGELFGFHRLSLEDALHLRQRPKADTYDFYQYLVLQVPYWGDEELAFEQVSVFVGKDFVVTMQAGEVNRLEMLRERLKRKNGRLVGSRSDYLAYAVLDVLVDQVFPVLESLDERMDVLEERLLSEGNRIRATSIHRVRADVTILRRMLWGQAMLLQGLNGPGADWVQRDTRPYMRDVQDHAERALGLAEQQREGCAGLLELLHSVNSSQLNEIIKVLTIISTIFIPLTFIVGVYGMNFENMPELRWPFGYLFVWGLMCGCAGAMVWMFRHRGWIGGQKPSSDR